jgi:hypothetical protein
VEHLKKIRRPDATSITLSRPKPISDESPIDVIGLHRVRKTFDVQNRLVKLDPIGPAQITGLRQTTKHRC